MTAPVNYRVNARARGPFRVETFDGIAIVLDANGVNWLSFPDKPGATLTTPERAAAIAAELNRSGVDGEA